MIQRHSFETKDGNTLSFFYNSDNQLLVVDLVAADQKSGRELIRLTINEPTLLSHTKN